MRNGRLYPGADDNASGVAMMLEVARTIVESPQPPRRSLMFIGFDLEEAGLFGSRYFVAHSPVPLERVALFITADMIVPCIRRRLRLARLRDGHRECPGPATLDRRGGARPLALRRSAGRRPARSSIAAITAHSAAKASRSCSSRPAKILATTPRRHAETLDYPKLTAISRMIGQVVRKAVDAPEIPALAVNPR